MCFIHLNIEIELIPPMHVQGKKGTFLVPSQHMHLMMKPPAASALRSASQEEK